MKTIDAETYQKSQPLRMAYLDGRLDLCEEIKEFAQFFLSRNNISPFKPADDIEKGKLAALNAIVERCIAIEEAVEIQSSEDTNYDA